MGQDFTKGLNVCIGNYGYYNEGSLHDAWITLPKTEAEIRDFLHLNQLQDSQHEEIYISDYDGIPFGTRLLFNEFCHLEDLNLLAKQLVTANPADLFLCKILPSLIKKGAPIAGCPKEKSARKINQRALASGS